jgi:hypothetical protein
MMTETIGKYQLHLLAYEIPNTGKWEAFLTVHRFDDTRQDFVCVTEKHPVSDSAYDSYDAALEAARQYGNEAVASGRF